MKFREFSAPPYKNGPSYKMVEICHPSHTKRTKFGQGWPKLFKMTRILTPDTIPICKNHQSFSGMGQILAVTGITPQILMVIGMGRGGYDPLKYGWARNKN